MANIKQVPQHVSATFEMPEVFDLIRTLAAAEREFADGNPVPESVTAIKEQLLASYDGDLPGDEFNVNEDGGARV